MERNYSVWIEGTIVAALLVLSLIPLQIGSSFQFHQVRSHSRCLHKTRLESRFTLRDLFGGFSIFRPDKFTILVLSKF